MRRIVVVAGIAVTLGALGYLTHRLTAVPEAESTPSAAALEPATPSPPPRPPRGLRVVSVRNRATGRETPVGISAHVRTAAARHGVPESLVAAVISVESEFNPRAVSQRGAQGLMQLMPATAVLLGVRDAFDPGENVDAGARHLRALLNRFSDVTLALAAYNAGPQAVVEYGGVPPYPETRAFVRRVLGRMERGIAAPSTAIVAVERRGRPRDATELSDPEATFSVPVMAARVETRPAPETPAEVPAAAPSPRPAPRAVSAIPETLTRSEAP
jgi:hypothetical protein